MDIERNDLCPCGSGKKYKKCCLSDYESACFAYAGVNEARGRVQDKVFHFLASIPQSEKFAEEFVELIGEPFSDHNAPIFLRWLFGSRKHKGGELWRRFNEGAEFDEGDALVAAGFLKARCGFFRVLSVKQNLGLDVQDILLKDNLSIYDISSSKRLEPGEVFSAVIYPVSEFWLIDSSLSLLGRGRGSRILERVMLAAGNGGRTLQQEAVFLSRNPMVFYRLRNEMFEEFSRPLDLRNSDGEELVLGRARYRINNSNEVRDFLSGLADFHTDDQKHFTWVRKSDSRVLGSVSINGVALSAEANSRPRLERLTSTLEKGLKEAITAQGRVFQDMYQAMAEHADDRPSVGSRPSGIDPEIERELLNKVSRAHYEKWLDEDIPLLGGKTPREAAKESEGRLMLEGILEDMEAMKDADDRGLDEPDIGRLRRELGIVVPIKRLEHAKERKK